jgi:hypothetical protein
VPAERLVDTRLQVPLDLGNVRRANAQFALDVQARGHLALQLLIYDTLVIPTKDFGIIPILHSWMGPSAFKEAIRHRAFSFVHLPAILGYVGNGNGISGFLIGPSEERPFEWWQTATFGDTDKALEAQVVNGMVHSSPKEASRLIKDIARSTTTLAYSNEEFTQDVARESYLDIMGSPELSALVSVLSGNPGKVDLTRVRGVEPNQVKALTLGPIRAPADVVLRVAEMNLDLLIAARTSEADLMAPRGADLVLRSKLQRAGIHEADSSPMLALLELTRLPDPSAAVAAGKISLGQIWKLRQSRTSRRFREWLRRVDAHDPRELERAYADSLQEEHLYDGLPVKAIRFLVTTGIGIAHPIAGVAASAADTFLLDRLAKGFRPKLFIDDLKPLLRDV